MSVPDIITRLQTAKTNIANAITAKGGTVASEDGFEDFAAAIAAIPAGASAVKSWDVTLSDAVGSTTTVVANDEWVAEHYNDSNLYLCMFCEEPRSGWSCVYWIYCCCSNSGIHKTYLTVGMGAPISIDNYYSYSKAIDSNANGEIILSQITENNSGTSWTCKFPSGKWKLIAFLKE